MEGMSSAGKRVGVLGLGLLASWGVAGWSPEWAVFWPSLFALFVVFALRSALMGLLAGALAGALILGEGSLVPALELAWQDLLLLL